MIIYGRQQKRVTAQRCSDIPKPAGGGESSVPGLPLSSSSNRRSSGVPTGTADHRVTVGTGECDPSGTRPTAGLARLSQLRERYGPDVVRTTQEKLRELERIDALLDVDSDDLNFSDEGSVCSEDYSNSDYEKHVLGGWVRGRAGSTSRGPRPERREENGLAVRWAA